jgi:D-threo-aldose 1-dehydrogenase
MGGITRRESIAVLETAFESGIRHFDTAPSYGYGEAEGVLGEAFRSRRDQITITTKYGIRPPRNRSLLGLARSLVLPAVKHVPSVKARLSRAAGGLVERARFSPEEMRSSVEASLTALQTDYIDILLLHEARVSDLTHELLAALERTIAEGKIRTFGIGSEASAAASIHDADRRFCRVMQFDWSVLSREKPAYAGSAVITHGSLLRSFAQLRAWLAATPSAGRAWSQELGQDVTSAAVLSRLMLTAARSANPQGITLFSSRRAENIKANAELLDESRLPEGAAFAALVTRDAPSNLEPAIAAQ